MAFPTGTIPLLEVLKEVRASQPAVYFAESIIYESNLMGMLPTRTVVGEAVRSEEEVSLPTPLFRQYNSVYANADWASDKEHFWGTTILGGEIAVDNKGIRQYGEANEKAKQTKKHAKAAAGFMNKNIIDGTGASNSFKGFNALIADGFGQTAIIDAATDGANPVTVGQDWLDEAQYLMRGHRAGVILTNRRNALAITKIGRALNNSMIGVEVNTFGNKVSTWDGIPIMTLGEDWQGNEILDFDETTGSSDLTSSVYFIALDGSVELLLGQGGSFDFHDFGEVSEFPGHKMRYELYPGLAVYDKHGLVRLTGLLDYTV